MIGIGGGLTGYLDGPVNSFWRILMIIGGFMLIIPDFGTDIIGAGIIFGILLLHRLYIYPKTGSK